MTLPHLAARIFATPLMIAPDKLDAILGVVGPRLGLDVAQVPAGPTTEPKQRADAQVLELLDDDGENEPQAARVAVVQVVGTLANRVDWMDAMSGLTSYEMLGDEIEKLAADPSVDAILLEVDSFGGEAAGCFDCADRIDAARKLKPVFGVANQYAMSAGYALLSQCDKVFVPQGGEVGSIGVVATHVDMTRAAEDAGIRVTHIHAGAHKVDMSKFRTLSPETLERLQADIETSYEAFATVVARGGRVDEAGAKATEALTYMGQKAVDVGLADAVGTKLEALEALRLEIKERDGMKSKQLEAQLAAQKAENTKLKAQVAQLLKGEAERQKAADARFLEDLRARSAAAHAPIPEARIAKVEAYMKAGEREFAMELGNMLLEACGDAKQTAFSTTTSAAPKSPEDEHHKAIVAGRMALLEADGCTEVKVTKTTEAETVIGFKDRRGNSGEQRLARKG